MKVSMGPPAPRNPNLTPEPSDGDPSVAQEAQAIEQQDGACSTGTMPPESEAKDPEKPTPDNSSSSGCQVGKLPVPYSIPPWSEPPGYPFCLEVLKDGAIMEQLDVSQKGAYMFGRVDLCDFVLEHPTISRFHAVLQFKKDEVLLYDLGSTHGTFINKRQVKKKVYTEVHVGDVIRFGLSSRLYIFQGPTELMPPEGDLEKLRNARIREEMNDREASLSRAKVDASLVNGISWGMQEDAIEEDTENGADEITWQTYKGQFTERQEKTRSKIIKRMEKVANMKKEIDAIRAKDISQGGLTQGQQTQIARNEQRISQIMEELDSLEETLNESIQESVGARTGKVACAKKKENTEDEDEMLSDDDDFYDRTKKRPSSRKSSEQQSVETVTADSLLDKKEAIINQIEDKKTLLLKEKEKVTTNSKNDSEDGDDLDVYMSGLSSQLVHDRIQKIQNELSDLQSELDKTMYLLKIADPMGETARKRDAKAKTPKSKSTPDIPKPPKSEEKQVAAPSSAINSKTEDSSSPKQAEECAEGREITEDQNANKPVYTVAKPQWLGATREMVSEENRVQETHYDENELDNFVDYKDRKKALTSVDDGTNIDQAAPGLIIRKRKPAHEAGAAADKIPKVGVSSSSEAEASAADAVALLLKHKRGYAALDEEEHENKTSKSKGKGKDNSQKKRVLGPSRPAFLDSNPDYESWVPPEGQTGDGRTSLNERLGY
ncbi:kanadaptin [Canna indica]|uniref:Kanadaptin n=1 Tax=Canna indica TaxID=4628 RepID=A0AAQ3KPB3_9LILI|nr:kanadaptin [Canna indica]